MNAKKHAPFCDYIFAKKGCVLLGLEVEVWVIGLKYNIYYDGFRDCLIY